MKARILLAGQNEARSLLTPITKLLRERGSQTSAYFEESIPFATRELDSFDFFILGLSRAGREPSSSAYLWEKGLVRAIKEQPRANKIPCCVISDVDGLISAHYLVEYGDLFRIVACTEQAQVDSLELFTNHQVVARDVTAITDAVCELLRMPARALAS